MAQRSNSTRQIPADIYDMLMSRIDGVQAAVRRLENNKKPTMPFYDSGNFPAKAVYGQVAADVVVPGDMYVYAKDDAWHRVGQSLRIEQGVTIVNPLLDLIIGAGLTLQDDGGGTAELFADTGAEAEAFSNSASLNLAALGSGVFSLQHDTGGTLLDYTSPTAPTVIKDGFYGISGTVVSGGCATPDYFDMKLGVDTTFGFIQYAEGRGYAPAVSTPYMKVSVAGVWPMSAGDSIAVTVLSGTVATTPFDWQDGTIVKLA